MVGIERWVADGIERQMLGWWNMAGREVIPESTRPLTLCLVLSNSFRAGTLSVMAEDVAMLSFKENVFLQFWLYLPNLFAVLHVVHLRTVNRSRWGEPVRCQRVRGRI